MTVAQDISLIPGSGLTIAIEEVDETDDIDEAHCGKTIEEDVEG
jgi:hypothetical protein